MLGPKAELTNSPKREEEYDLPSISELQNKTFLVSTTLVLSQVEIYPIPIEEMVTAHARF